MNGILRPEVEYFSLAASIESSGRNRILSSTVELCLPTGKCQASAREISILRPEVESFPRRMVFSEWNLRMSQSNSTESYRRKVIVATSFELTLSNRKFQSSAWWNLILSPEDQSLRRRIPYSLTGKFKISPSQVIFALPGGRWWILQALIWVCRLGCTELLLGRAKFSGRKMKFTQAEWHSSTESERFLLGKLYWILRPEGDRIYQHRTPSFDGKVPSLGLVRLNPPVGWWNFPKNHGILRLEVKYFSQAGSI